MNNNSTTTVFDRLDRGRGGVGALRSCGGGGTPQWSVLPAGRHGLRLCGVLFMLLLVGCAARVPAIIEAGYSLNLGRWRGMATDAARLVDAGRPAQAKRVMSDLAREIEAKQSAAPGDGLAPVGQPSPLIPQSQPDNTRPVLDRAATAIEDMHKELQK